MVVEQQSSVCLPVPLSLVVTIGSCGPEERYSKEDSPFFPRVCIDL